jgi:hypothetical protein
MAIESLTTFKSHKHSLDIYAFENLCAPGLRDRAQRFFKEWYVNDRNCLAASWNRGIKYGFDNSYDYVIVPNLDVILNDDTIDKLVEYAEKHKDYGMFSPWCTNKDRGRPRKTYDVKPDYTSYDTYAFFMVNRNFLTMEEDIPEFDIVTMQSGDTKPMLFDENHKPAYGEDVDMQIRMNAKGLKHVCYYSSKFIHYDCATIRLHSNPGKAMEELTERAGSGRYFELKWGGQPREQKYERPWMGFKGYDDMKAHEASYTIRKKILS